jgi:hypothetical protein
LIFPQKEKKFIKKKEKILKIKKVPIGKKISQYKKIHCLEKKEFNISSFFNIKRLPMNLLGPF